VNSTINLIYLGIAIGTEVIGTLSLKTSESFTKLLPSAVSILCYSAAFYTLLT
jgi:small multidrug resistance pump